MASSAHGGARELAGRPKEILGARQTCSFELTAAQSAMIAAYARINHCSRSQVLRAILSELCTDNQLVCSAIIAAQHDAENNAERALVRRRRKAR